ncbi:MAG: hypothetical protein CEO12_515 [Parcubacteria group bacterium Gr01-1014_46]|nr:MAG: hypothetical protein CEO12_515 [Parcubacteria group bacterium Gr01-1014_46]
MALIDMKKLVVVLALAVFAVACASKSRMREVPVPIEVLEAQLVEVGIQIKNLVDLEKSLREQGVSLRSVQIVQVRARQIELKNRETVILDQLDRRGRPATKEARKQLQREINAENKNAKVWADALRDSELSGCDPSTVKVKPGGQIKFDPFNIFPSTLRIRLLNAGKSPINLDTSMRSLGEIVSNLCPGGKINVAVELGFWEPSQPIPITASTTLPDGRVVEETRYFYIQKSTYNQYIDNQNWSVNLSNR